MKFEMRVLHQAVFNTSATEVPMTFSVNHLQAAIDQRGVNYDDEARSLGVEIEFSDLEPNKTAQIVQEMFGGKINWLTPFEIEVDDTQFGCFKIELDSSQVQAAGKKSDIEGDLAEQEILSSDNSLELAYMKALNSVANTVVPWEVVTPPLRLRDLPNLYSLVKRLRDAGAKGTRDAVYYSFGVHLNPEATQLTPEAIVKHLRSFFCMYEWVISIEKPDIARRLSPYINHFPEAYILKVLDPNYQPSLDQLIIDYIEHNPTRNRDLDMLPMFAFLNPKIIDEHFDDERINARPTYHYRLPNCDIDNPEWNVDLAVEMWMLIEELAVDPKLPIVCEEYRSYIKDNNGFFSDKWEDRVTQLLSLPKLQSAK